MITGISNINLLVQDQESAKRFYTEILGFEIRQDMESDGFRWLTVGPKGQPDVQLILTEPNQPMFDAESAQQLRALLAKGALTGGVLETSDCRATFDELKAKGVTFLQEPTDRPWAVEAVFRDDSGSWWSLAERKQFG